MSDTKQQCPTCGARDYQFCGVNCPCQKHDSPVEGGGEPTSHAGHKLIIGQGTFGCRCGAFLSGEWWALENGHKWYIEHLEALLVEPTSSGSESRPVKSDHGSIRVAASLPDSPAAAGSGAFNLLAKEIYDNNRNVGWWTHDEANKIPIETVATKLCLIHSEISEALEGARKNLRDDHLPDRPMIEVELADAMIRILDLAGALRLDLDGAFADKREYNRTRNDHKKEVRNGQFGKSI